MRLCDTVITVFNSRYDPETDSELLYGTVITAARWFCEIASTVDGSGLKAANRYTIRIPLDADFSGKSYVKPEDYETSDPATAFTFRNGDAIVKGAISESPLKLVDLQRRYSEMTTILGVTDSTTAPNAKHWRIVGK